jgi:transposase-like protein
VEKGLVDLLTIDDRDETACYQALVRLLHPDGLACPKCGAREGLGVHRRHRDPLVDYQCSHCRRVFNAWSGTAIENARLPPSALLRLVRGMMDRQASATLAKQVGCSRSALLRWRGRLHKALAAQLPTLRQSPPAEHAG